MGFVKVFLVRVLQHIFLVFVMSSAVNAQIATFGQLPTNPFDSEREIQLQLLYGDAYSGAFQPVIGIEVDADGNILSKALRNYQFGSEPVYLNEDQIPSWDTNILSQAEIFEGQDLMERRRELNPSELSRLNELLRKGLVVPVTQQPRLPIGYPTPGIARLPIVIGNCTAQEIEDVPTYCEFIAKGTLAACRCAE